MPNQPITPAPQQPDLLDLFQLDAAILADVAAQRARRSGLLKAKQEALKSAQRLAQWGRKLLVGVLVVSFIHLWEQISLIRPSNVPELPLPAEAYHVSSALLTLAIDAVAFYLVATRSTSAYAGNKRQSWSVYFYYLLTFLLNGMFVLRYSPNMPEWVAAVLPFSQVLTAILLALLIPTSIAAVEKAHHIADAARLALIVETETLQGQVAADAKTAAHEEEEQRFQEEIARQRWEMEKERQRAEIKRLLEQPAAPALPPPPPARPIVAKRAALTDTATTTVIPAPVHADSEPVDAVPPPAPAPAPQQSAVAPAPAPAPAAAPALPAIQLPPSDQPAPFDSAALLAAIQEPDVNAAVAFFNGASAPRAYMQVRTLLPADVTLVEFTAAYDALMKSAAATQPLRAIQVGQTGAVVTVSPTRYETYMAILEHLPDLGKTGKIASAINKTARTVQNARNELEELGIIRKDGDLWERTDVQLAPEAA